MRSSAAIGSYRIARDGKRNVTLDATSRHSKALLPREREVMALVVAGRPNAQIAAVMGISMTTVKMYRGQVMRKMDASSLAELVRMAATSSHPVPKYRSASTIVQRPQYLLGSLPIDRTIEAGCVALRARSRLVSEARFACA